METTHELEDALRRIGFAEQSGDLQAHGDAALRSTKAIRAVLDNAAFWQRLKKAERQPGAKDLDVDWEMVGELLGDRLANAMIRVGYQPPPPANELVKAAGDLARELAMPNLPAASREDLVGACRTWLVRLHNRLYSLTMPTTDQEMVVSEATTPAVSSMLRSSKPALLGMVVVGEVSSLQGDVNLRLHGTDASMNLVVRWMTCLESDEQAVG